jgi:integrase
MTTTYDVRIWNIEQCNGQRGATYKVRWAVAGKRHKKAFRTRALADSFRSDLISAQRKGHAFAVDPDLPVSMASDGDATSWFDFACRYVDMKWPGAAATYRRGIAEAMTTVTTALIRDGVRGKPDDAVIRSALCGWAFNTGRRGDADRPDHVSDALRWIAHNTRPVSALADPVILRPVLDAIAHRLDGKAGAASVVNRKRMVLANALSYAVELSILQANPLSSVKWTRPKSAQLLDRRSVVNPVQARTLLNAVGQVQRSGPRLVALFGAIYFAALRPEEAVNLRKCNLALPAEGWGEVHLEEATPHAGKSWTDSGEARDRRQLKHRARGEGRTVPCPPELTALLRDHLAHFGTDAEGRLFTGEQGRELAAITYSRVWRQARAATFTAEVQATPLVRRPYDLRHAAVSTWLNGGVPAAQVAEWAGHSVEVLLKVYAKCLDGQGETARRRVLDALGYL